MSNRLERDYEGPAALADLLKRSGCELTVDEVVEEFVCAVEEGTQANEIIPRLWELEPTFATPAEARRTFSNLFGLWDEVASDATAGLVLLEVPADPSAALSPGFVEGAWLELEAQADGEGRRDRDRYENLQGDLGAWIFEQVSTLSTVSAESALELAFESWWILDRAGRSMATATRTALNAALADEISAEAEPALASMATTTLFEAAAEEARPLPEDEIASIERVLRAVRATLR